MDPTQAVQLEQNPMLQLNDPNQAVQTGMPNQAPAQGQGAPAPAVAIHVNPQQPAITQQAQTTPNQAVTGVEKPAATAAGATPAVDTNPSGPAVDLQQHADGLAAQHAAVPHNDPLHPALGQARQIVQNQITNKNAAQMQNQADLAILNNPNAAPADKTAAYERVAAYHAQHPGAGHAALGILGAAMSSFKPTAGIGNFLENKYGPAAPAVAMNPLQQAEAQKDIAQAGEAESVTKKNALPAKAELKNPVPLYNKKGETVGVQGFNEQGQPETRMYGAGNTAPQNQGGGSQAGAPEQGGTGVDRSLTTQAPVKPTEAVQPFNDTDLNQANNGLADIGRGLGLTPEAAKNYQLQKGQGQEDYARVKAQLDNLLALKQQGSQDAFQRQVHNDSMDEKARQDAATAAQRAETSTIEKQRLTDSEQKTRDAQIGKLDDVVRSYHEGVELASQRTGPGDYGLTMRFVEATKPSSGFRFTNTELQLIKNSRSLLDSAQANVGHMTKGTLYDDKQRQQMLDVMKVRATMDNARKTWVQEGNDASKFGSGRLPDNIMSDYLELSGGDAKKAAQAARDDGWK